MSTPPSGVDFGRGFGDRLDWLEEALQVVRPLMAGEEVTHEGPHYRTDRLRLAPPPLQARIPIMVGGVGEKKTLRSVARHADIWNAQLELDEAPHKLEVLRAHCADAGRDPAEIELTYNCTIVIRDREAEAQAVLDRQVAHNTLDPRDPRPRFWAGTVESIAERLAGFVDAGFHGFTIEEMAPFDDETLVRLIGEVKPLVEHG